MRECAVTVGVALRLGALAPIMQYHRMPFGASYAKSLRRRHLSLSF